MAELRAAINLGQLHGLNQELDDARAGLGGSLVGDAAEASNLRSWKSRQPCAPVGALEGVYRLHDLILDIRDYSRSLDLFIMKIYVMV